MVYLITFLEGVVSFISPCMLPMLPIYISYFGGQSADGKRNGSAVLPRACAFVLGFTVVFTSLGLFAGTLGKLLSEHQTAVNIVGGVVVIIFGLSYLGALRIPLFKGMTEKREITGVFSAFLFGAVYSVSLTPCVGAFLGSALMLASGVGGAARGAFLLLVYSLGLGIPFILSAVLLDKLSGAFGWIKRNYKLINAVCGTALIAVGVLMTFGLLNKALSVIQ